MDADQSRHHPILQVCSQSTRAINHSFKRVDQESPPYRNDLAEAASERSALSCRSDFEKLFVNDDVIRGTKPATVLLFPRGKDLESEFGVGRDIWRDICPVAFADCVAGGIVSRDSFRPWPVTTFGDGSGSMSWEDSPLALCPGKLSAAGPSSTSRHTGRDELGDPGSQMSQQHAPERVSIVSSEMSSSIL